jgi:two-component system, OmpR family, response regulator VicR
MKKILLVEDDKMISDVYVRRLKLEGFEVTQAFDGEQGLTLACADHPDLILLDIIMPKMDGMTVLSKLRQDEWGKNVAVILLTNKDTDDEILNNVVKDQPAYYLLKANTDLDHLVEKVKIALGLEKIEV